MGNSVDISIVIPTKDRPGDLAQCIKSIQKQNDRPREVIIIDDGKMTAQNINELRKTLHDAGIPLEYIKKDRPGLSLSRNLGVSRSRSPVVLFLDDDVILDPNYVSVLKNRWDQHGADEKFGGVGGLYNLRKIFFFEKVFNFVFLLTGRLEWDVTDVGFQVWDPAIKKDLRASYLPGGITAFRKSLLEKIPFRQLSPGRTPGDEVEVFLKAKKGGYYFLITPSATLIHNESPVNREQEYGRGKKEGFNQCLIFADNVPQTTTKRIQFLWSSAGWILRQFLAGHIKRAAGMISGYLAFSLKKRLIGKRGNEEGIGSA